MANKSMGMIFLLVKGISTQKLLSDILEKQGYYTISSASIQEFINALNKEDIDVVLIDMMMPVSDTVNLLDKLKKNKSDVPMILMSSDSNIEKAREIVKMGAYDYFRRPIEITDMLICIERAIERRKLLKKVNDYEKTIDKELRERTSQFVELMVELEKSLKSEREAHLESIIVLSKAAEINDYYTGDHIKRVSLYSKEIAKALHLTNEFIEKLTYSSPMHDIGKICIDPSILNKPGKLSENEFEKVKTHTIKGAEILEGIPFLKIAREISLYHHEKYNGSGYPYGIPGIKIPLSAMIVSLSDVFDALISKRCYKLPLPLELSFEIIESESGISFDPEIVKAFLRIKESIKNIAMEYGDKEGGGERIED